MPRSRVRIAGSGFLGIGLLVAVIALTLWLTQGRPSVQACEVVQIGALVDRFQTEGRLASGDCLPGTNVGPQWTDMYDFRLIERSQLTVVLESRDLSPGLVLIDADGARTITEDVGSEDEVNVVRIARDLPAGEYELWATKSGEREGNYQLRLSVISAALAQPDQVGATLSTPLESISVRCAHVRVDVRRRGALLGR